MNIGKPRRAIWLLMLVACVTLATDASAVRESRRDEVRRKIRTVKSWRIMKDLNLDDTQARSFLPALESYEADRDRLRDERGAIEAELDSLLKDGSSRARREIRERLEKIKVIDQRQDVIDREFKRKVGRILTPEQHARYELFERDFDASLRKMIREVRDESGRVSRDPAQRRGSAYESKKSEPERRVKSKAGGTDSLKRKNSRDNGKPAPTRKVKKTKSGERPSRGEKPAGKNSEERTARP